MVKAEWPEREGEPRLPVADRADPAFDVLNVAAQHRLVREPGDGIRPLTHTGDLRIWTVGEDLKGQISGLPPRLGVQSAERGSNQKTGEENCAHGSNHTK